MIAGIIPARYASTRFPGKPLVKIGGISMIERVYRQCQKAAVLDAVIVATDDERIANEVRAFGGEVCMTATHHETGTDRLCEVVGNLSVDFQYFINIQGDEPFIQPEAIALLANGLLTTDNPIVTLIKKINSPEILLNPNVVKVVKNFAQEALYFSRFPIPFHRQTGTPDLSACEYFQHIGIYGFTRAFLQQLPTLQSGKYEKMESLEQLRWLENGHSILTVTCDYQSIAIDAPEDVSIAEAFLQKGLGE